MIKKSPILAAAQLAGSKAYPDIHGRVFFRQMEKGVMVTATVFGLPVSKEICEEKIFGFHLHEGEECGGADAFSEAKMHYNPDNCPHPHHAGDFPPLFGTKNGYAYLSFLTDRFSLREVIGKTVIIHAEPDDFTTQPAGNAGERIACGSIIKK